MDEITYRDIFEDSGVRVIRTKSGRYRWRIDSGVSFHSPFAAMKDAIDVIGGDLQRFDEPDTDESLPVGELRVKTEIEWAPIVPLK